MCIRDRRNTEKTSEVVEKPEGSETGQQVDDNTPPPPGHGRNGAEAFGGARRVDIKHQKLSHGDRCPESVSYTHLDVYKRQSVSTVAAK